MKNLLFYTMAFSVFASILSCEKEKSKKVEDKTVVESYIVDSENSIINWTAYKTTDKIPVTGVFEKVNITENKPASNRKDLLKGLEFEIPVGSINSNDSIRDFKLVKFFFGVMENTISLKGKFTQVENGKGIININMNGITNDLPFTFEIKEDDILIKSVIDLDNWQAQLAIESLNKVCSEKHKAADGISKTWSEVAISVEIKTILDK